MRSADKQVITNQPGDVGRQRPITEFPPTHIDKSPDFERKGDTLSNGAERRKWKFVSALGRNALEPVNAIHELHQQSLAWLAWPIASDEFAINSILRRLCVARDLERDRVFRV